MSVAGLFNLRPKPEPLPTMREMMLQRAKEHGQKTTWMDGKEYAVIGSDIQHNIKEKEMKLNKHPVQEMMFGGGYSGGGGSSSSDKIKKLEKQLREKTDENVLLMKKCTKLEQALNKIQNKEKVYI